MNNYNELRNKPTINGKEVIGEVTIPVPKPEDLLPTVTAEDAGKVLMVNESGEWSTGTVSGGGGISATSNYNIISSSEASSEEDETND